MNEITRKTGLTSTQDNGRSGIPMPSSAMKKSTQNKRLSVAGPASRGAYPPPMVPSTNPRQSLFRSQNSNPLLASASKHGRTPLSSSARRGSLWGGGAGVLSQASIQPLKDTRPLRDRQYQTKMRQDIVAWLQSTEYDMSMQTLMNITGKEYRNIFQYLISMLDPVYPFDHQARFEDEFILALKCIRYPFVGQVDPRWLAAPASMHSWPSLLGVLHWLTVMCKVRSERLVPSYISYSSHTQGRLHYMESEHPTLQFSEIIPEEFDDPHHHAALAFDYFAEAYESFFQAKKNERIEADLEKQKAELAKVKAELEKLQTTPAPIDKLLSDNKFLKRDREKFQECIRSWEGRKKTLISHIANLKTDITQQTSNLEQLKTEQERLSEVVKEQNISPEEVVRMNTEHEQLSRSLEDLKLKIAESQKTILSLEVAVANHTDLQVELNTAASQPEYLLKGPDVRQVIKPTINAIIAGKRSERAAVENERINVDHELDQLISECENLEDEINETENKVMVLNEQADDLREVAQREALASNAEITRLERDLIHARTAALSSGTGIKSRLQALQIAYREQVEKVARLRDETVRAIVKNSTEIAMFKEEISQQLKTLRDFAEAGPS
ncbi:HEC/Ndc80p family-domain-containing protein [Lactifluus volemus]|nr:HEC/Ndc80p family-domain-containing protein [Lactifluus volemus]